MEGWILEGESLTFPNPRIYLGAGGQGLVEKALYDGRDVAVKALISTTNNHEEIIREGAVLVRLRHPNIIFYYGLAVSSDQQQQYLVMEYIHGSTLQQRLMSILLDWPKRLSIAYEIAAAVVYIHKYDVLHRDLKSPNVLVDADSHAKLTDFGLASLQSSMSSRSGPYWD